MGRERRLEPSNRPPERREYSIRCDLISKGDCAERRWCLHWSRKDVQSPKRRSKIRTRVAM